MTSTQLQVMCRQLDCSVKHIEASFDDDFPVLKHLDNTDSVHPFIRCLRMAYDQHIPLLLRAPQVWLLIVHSAECMHSQHVFESHALAATQQLFAQTRPSLSEVARAVSRMQLLRRLRKSTFDRDLGHVVNANEMLMGHVVRDMAISHAQKAPAKLKRPKRCAIVEESEAAEAEGEGFVSIRLDGAKAEWEALRRKVAALSVCGARKRSLLRVVDKCVAAFDGERDPHFWNAHGMGDGEGWVDVLFGEREDDGDGDEEVDAFGAGLCFAPIKARKFVAGFVGVQQLQTAHSNYVTPKIGWFMVNTSQDADDTGKQSI